MKRNILLLTGAAFVLGVMIYTAWQAHHRSNEILNAFDTVNQAMHEQSDSLQSGMATTEKDILETKDVQKIHTWQAIHHISEGTSQYIDSLRYLIESNSINDDDIDVADRLLVQSPQGLRLYHSLQVYKTEIDSLMSVQNMPGDIPIDLTPAGPGEGKPDTTAVAWVRGYFHSVPSVAAITILNKLRNDIKASEYICSKRLLHK